MNFKKQLREGLLTKNPVLAQLLGMCSTLAITTSLFNGLGMGLAVTVILICSNVLISALRKVIPSQIRIAAYIVIVSGFVTAVELLMRAYFYSLYQALGLFIPLIVVTVLFWRVPRRLRQRILFCQASWTVLAWDLALPWHFH